MAAHSIYILFRHAVMASAPTATEFILINRMIITLSPIIGITPS